ncbi:hypothetical protein AAON49_07565 [Pseudotenacibaculum sp. MALMAid0570]|uniref:DUF7868 domain-containing protein n=1 Tax=Pseudotenacibaculum sp. MALMAid0570 TaxID=3143938 RepID=UPI0032DE5C53
MSIVLAQTSQVQISFKEKNVRSIVLEINNAAVQQWKTTSSNTRFRLHLNHIKGKAMFPGIQIFLDASDHKSIEKPMLGSLALYGLHTASKGEQGEKVKGITEIIEIEKSLHIAIEKVLNSQSFLKIEFIPKRSISEQFSIDSIELKTL